MVEFCTVCGASLPKGDLTFKRGKAYTSPDYVCPVCSSVANPGAEAEPAEPPEPATDRDIVFRKGSVSTE